MKNVFIYIIRVVMVVILACSCSSYPANAQTIKDTRSEQLLNRSLQNQLNFSKLGLYRNNLSRHNISPVTNSFFTTNNSFLEITTERVNFLRPRRNIIYLQDHNGTPLVSLKINRRGKIIWIRSLTDLTALTQYNSNNDLVAINLVDGQGLIQQTFSIGQDGNVSGNTVFNYNSAGTLISSDSFNADGMLVQKTLYSESGDKESIESYDDAGAIIAISYFYKNTPSVLAESSQKTLDETPSTRVQQTPGQASFLNLVPIKINQKSLSESIDKLEDYQAEKLMLK